MLSTAATEMAKKWSMWSYTLGRTAWSLQTLCLTSIVILLLVTSAGAVPQNVHPASSPQDGVPGAALKIMTVGDSITHGQSGDFTWRYRLWQWFQMKSDVNVQFVGPYRGLNPSPPPIVAEGAADPCPCTWGDYHKDVDPSFLEGNNYHFAVWGRTIGQVEPLIEEMVAVHQPDMVLMLMGFNDIAWFGTTAEDLLDHLRAVINNARKAKPDIKFAISDVPQRSMIEGFDNLITQTFLYRHYLPGVLDEMSIADSPAKFVELSQVYDCMPAYCPSGYGGLHPNAAGEYEIAWAFAKTLHDSYHIGNGYLDVPEWNEMPLRNVSVPDNFVANVQEPGVLKLTWDVVFGVFAYSIRHRAAGSANWEQAWGPIDQPFFINNQLKAGIAWEFSIRSEYGTPEQGGRWGNWSTPIVATVT